LQVLTHENRPSIAWFDRSYKDEVAMPGSPFRPLTTMRSSSTNNPLPSSSPKSLRLPATRRRSSGVEYEVEPHETDLKEARGSSQAEGKQVGPSSPRETARNAKRVFKRAAVQHDAEYALPIEHHNVDGVIHFDRRVGTGRQNHYL
jgi:xanthine dehydrogenase YagR molybdenum-binding subunit